MVNTRIFTYSHKLFSGFQRQIDLDNVNSIPEIIDLMFIYLLEVLHRENFEILIKELERKRLHIHDFTFEQILLSPPEIIYYICDHNCDQKEITQA